MTRQPQRENSNGWAALAYKNADKQKRRSRLGAKAGHAISKLL
jgi:hypothetical protein